MDIRLQKFLAEAGVASRRKSEELIASGKVKVNDKVIREMGYKINPKKDVVKYNDKVIGKKEAKVYILLNKPKGYVTTAKDQFDRPTVLDLIKDVDLRIYPVGRLDYDTTGLLILTNDGQFSYEVTHPKHELTKTYRAVIRGVPNNYKLEKLRKGIQIEDYTTAPAKVKIIDKQKNTSTVEITIHEGKNRQVKKMLEAIGHPVVKLKRVAIGDLYIGHLKEGCYRHLTKQERIALMK